MLQIKPTTLAYIMTVTDFIYPPDAVIIKSMFSQSSQTACPRGKFLSHLNVSSQLHLVFCSKKVKFCDFSQLTYILLKFAFRSSSHYFFPQKVCVQQNPKDQKSPNLTGALQIPRSSRTVNTYFMMVLFTLFAVISGSVHLHL